MSEPFGDAQRIVLRGGKWAQARHLILAFDESSATRHFLHRLKEQVLPLKQDVWPTAAGVQRTELQVSLGLSRRGLERARVPKHVLACFALKSPAFFAGAAMRAARFLGASGGDRPEAWDKAFGFTTLDAVLSLHAAEGAPLQAEVDRVLKLAAEIGVRTLQLPAAERVLDPPDGVEPDPAAQWVHFGYRDGLSRIGIKGSTPEKELAKCSATSRHEAGEFLLGHAQDSGANPWIAGPGLRAWPDELRRFFHNGSFGVLYQVEQDVAAFEAFVEKAASTTLLKGDEIKAKLCGRYPDGHSLVAPTVALDEDNFHYGGDRDGHLCPLGSHMRRMNPRGDSLAHAARARPLLRRGMPYGPPWKRGGAESGAKRGLMGQFFCASIEDQFEHLIGQWADRVPLGSADGGGARDPLIGAHEPGDGAFDIPGRGERAPELPGLRAFTRTAGAAYLFYPSLTALQGIADSNLWREKTEDDQ